jgi:hypothetical protein
MGKSCRDLAQSLVDCVKKSKCMQPQPPQGGGGGALPPPDLRECMQKEMAEDCKVSAYTYTYTCAAALFICIRHLLLY